MRQKSLLRIEARSHGEMGFEKPGNCAVREGQRMSEEWYCSIVTQRYWTSHIPATLFVQASRTKESSRPGQYDCPLVLFQLLQDFYTTSRLIFFIPTSIYASSSEHFEHSMCLHVYFSEVSIRTLICFRKIISLRWEGRNIENASNKWRRDVLLNWSTSRFDRSWVHT